jgi:site-specific DNA-cytosine methylase
MFLYLCHILYVRGRDEKGSDPGSGGRSSNPNPDGGSMRKVGAFTYDPETGTVEGPAAYLATGRLEEVVEKVASGHSAVFNYGAAAAPGAQNRIAAGRSRHGNRFLTQHVTAHPGVPLDEPIRTITTKDQWAVVDGDRYRPLTIREMARGMGFPDSYRWPEGCRRTDKVKGLGNAVCPPVAKALIERVAMAA